jgi:hypothetical protein
MAGLTPNSDEDNQELLSDVNQINYVKSNTNFKRKFSNCKRWY